MYRSQIAGRDELPVTTSEINDSVVSIDRGILDAFLKNYQCLYATEYLYSKDQT